MANDEFQFQLLDTSRLGELAEMFRLCFGQDVSEDYFRWKYLSSPAGEVTAFTAESQGRVAAFRRQRGRLGEELIVRGRWSRGRPGRVPPRQLPVHFVGRDLDESRWVRGGQRRAQECMGPVDVGPNEGRVVRDRTIHMGLGSKIEDGIRLPDEVAHQGGVTNIAVNEVITWIRFQPGEVV